MLYKFIAHIILGILLLPMLFLNDNKEHKTPEELARNSCPASDSRASDSYIHSEPASLFLGNEMIVI